MRPNASTGYRGPPSEPVAGNNKIVFVALGALFGLAVFMFAMHIFCVKCILGRFEETVTLGPEEGMEAMSPGTDITEWRRRNRRRGFFGEWPRENHPSMNSHLGLDKAVVDILPTFIFNHEAPPVRDIVECAVCLAEFADGDQGRLLPTCKHCFHVECIDMWFFSHSSCPLCRREVSLDFLEDFTLDQQVTRSQSCPRFYDHFLSSLSPSASFRDLRSFLEESGSGGQGSTTTTSISSPFSDITSQATTAEITSRGTTGAVAVTIPENDATNTDPGTSNVSGTDPDLESGASPKSESATVAAIEIGDEGCTSSGSKPPDPEVS